MNTNNNISLNHIRNKAEKFAKETLKGDCTGHDWHHIERVRKIALYIGKKEKADLFIIDLASLLHDVGDYKFTGGDEKKGPKIIKDFLISIDTGEDIIEEVCNIIEKLSFKGAGVASVPETLEGKIVQDADRLDAIGAIGIARTFAYGGYKGQEIYNPEIKPYLHKNFEEYKEKKTTTINHFYEKLLLLKDIMNTKTAKKIAEKRHSIMKEFLDNFHSEWEGAFNL